MANLDALTRALKGFVTLHRWMFFTEFHLVKLYWASSEETSKVFADPNTTPFTVYCSQAGLVQSATKIGF